VSERPDYLPVAEHGVIGDLHTVALVGTDGTIDWYCAPRFDSPSVFGALLDCRRGGYYRIAPEEPDDKAKQLYFPDTNVLITRYLDADGVGEVQDFMPVARTRPGAEPQRIVRRVLAIRGAVRFRLELEPRFNYGRDPHEIAIVRGGAILRSSELTLALSTTEELERTEHGVRCHFELAAGQTTTFVLEAAAEIERPQPVGEEHSLELLEEATRFWRDWLGRSRYGGRWREMVHRSALTLKLLTYRPTGAIVAAPTTSLPEQIGGCRNWDYRYAWIRDAAFSVYALLRLGFVDEAHAFVDWMRQIRERETSALGPLQVMYGVDGRTELPEVVLDHFEGYRGSGPVRVGNAAATQLQLDIYGEFIDSVYISERHGLDRGGPLISHAAWRSLAAIADWVAENWEQADEGIWEVRNGRQHFTYSRLMCWVALDRAARIATQRSLPGDVVRWMTVRDQIFDRIMERSWSPERSAFAQAEGSSLLDASLLLMPLVHFVAPTDPRWLSTLDAIGTDLVSDSLVYRYDPVASPDGLEGEEGTFSMCSFWYVEALARAGRIDEARLAFDKMLTYGNHLGLYSEQISPRGELLGNFPQAFTHVSLISAAVHLDRELDRSAARGS
jgi:GH15 family glucan-1,4-alpha-glucosidase